MAPITAHAPMSSLKLGAGSIASRWPKLQGSESWHGLLEPLDADLRASVIAYGELAEAAYDGFNSEERSPHAGKCLYSRADLLAASGVSHPEHYTVTKFLYANCGWGQSPASRSAAAPTNEAFFVLPVEPLRDGSWWKETNWIGYVAVATDEGVASLGRRDIVVAWRGTVRSAETFNDLDMRQAPAQPVLGTWHQYHFRDAKVHRGFLSVYTAKDKNSMHNETSAQDQALQEVRRLMVVHKDEVTSITVTGHSLGAALATLNAVDMVANGVNVPPSPSGQRPCPVTAIVFACPHVGNENFKDAFASFPDLRALHVKNIPDLVPLFPTRECGYVDSATVTLPIDTDRSPYLRNTTVTDHVWRSHNLECYLHGLAGDHGAGKEFKLVVDRDVALVNKGTNSLKDEYPVPANWWVINNKCMVKGIDGHWKLDDFKED